MGTGKEQRITITSNSGLSDEEIERMVKEAELNAEADKQRKEAVEVRNEADQLVFTTEKTLKEVEGKVDQAEIDIPVNVAAQETAQVDIKSQKGVVDGVKDNPEEYKIQQKLLAKLESNYTKLQKENESLHKTITDSNAKIKQAELDIEANLEAQEAAKKQIADQRLVVDAVQKKLDEARSQKIK